MRRLPQLERLLDRLDAAPLQAQHGHAPFVAVARDVLDGFRRDLLTGACDAPPTDDALIEQVRLRLTDGDRPHLRRVINATGVVLHTNLGRAPLAPEAAEAALQAAGYGALEFDLDSGRRGSRTAGVEPLLREVCGAEAALAVNNAAAAVLLALSALAAGGEVIVSRGELVEIGGGFRIPDVIVQGGARLVEVGTTNRTRLADYAAAITPDTRVLLKVHQSNYRMLGFTGEASLAELANLARAKGLLLMHDLGGGALVDLRRLGLPHELTVQESLAAGADLVAFSGDKLLGGPQAGLLVGREAALAPLRRHPLLRAVRLDKMTLAALEATLRLYRDPERAVQAVPALAVLGQALSALQARAERLGEALRARRPGGLEWRVEPSEGFAGGGTLPAAGRESRALTLAAPPGADAAAARLRKGDPPVVARIGGRAAGVRHADGLRRRHRRARRRHPRGHGRLNTAQPRLTLGVMGHVDHGKTALVRALTGMETDRLPEEKRRGVSIVLGFAHARFGEAEVDFIDMPGHERFVRTLVSGATGVDAALLVVDAGEGVKPQTVEHLEIAALLGVERVLPVLTKIDLASPETAAATARAVREALADARLAAPEPLPVSVVDGSGMEALRSAIVALAAERAPPPDYGLLWLPIDRAFSVAGRGTVATGTLRRGRLTAGDPLALSPGGEPVRARALQVHGVEVQAAEPGQRVAVNLRNVEPSAVPRGVALAPPGVLAPSRWLSVTLRAASSAPPLKTGARLNLLFGAAEVDVRLRLLDRDTLDPCEDAVAQLQATEPVAVPARERFVLRRASPAATVAGGRIVDPVCRRLRRRDPAILARLSALAVATPQEAVALELAVGGAQGMTVRRLTALSGLSPARIVEALEAAGAASLPVGVAVLRSALMQVSNDILGALSAEAEAQPNGLARRRLAAAVPHASAEILDAAVAALAKAGRVQAEGGSVKLAPPREDAAARSEREAALAAALARRLQAAGLAPPDLAEIAPTAAARRALERLLQAGEGIMAFDRVQKRELVFHRDAVADARARLAPRLDPPGLTVSEAGAVLGVTRKFSVPLLEYLDTARFTRRLGDRRVLGPAARD